MKNELIGKFYYIVLVFRYGCMFLVNGMWMFYSDIVRISSGGIIVLVECIMLEIMKFMLKNRNDYIVMWLRWWVMLSVWLLLGRNSVRV